MRRTKTLAAAVAAILTAALLVSGCGMGASVRPSVVGGDQWRLSAVFDDALNLPHGAPVKLGGVVIGKVVRVRPDDYRARVDMAIDKTTRLREGSTFRLRYTTALGEMYVDVLAAEKGTVLAENALVEGPAATTAATVEDTLASASLLINGGSLGQVQTIVSELNTALGGRVGVTKGLLSETDEFLRQALLSTREIDRVLVALNRASKTLDRREATVNKALEQLRPAARALTENTDDLARLLRQSDRLAVVSNRLVKRTRSDLTTVVRELGPVLEEVLGAQKQIVPGLDVINDFALRIDDRAPTDYLNLKFLLHVDSVLGGSDDGTQPGLPGLPDVPGLPGVPNLPNLPGLPALPGVPDLPRLDGTARAPKASASPLPDLAGLLAPTVRGSR